MKRIKFKKLTGAAAALIVLLFFISAPVWSGTPPPTVPSDRLDGAEGIEAIDYTLERVPNSWGEYNYSGNGRTYSAGIDTVYSQVAGGDADKTRCYLKCEDNNDFTNFDKGAIRVALYDYLGNQVSVSTAVDCPNSDDMFFSQFVKMDPSGAYVWITATTWNDFNSGEFYKVPFDPATSDFGTPVWQFNKSAAWEIEWRDDGAMFYAAKGGDFWDAPHSIYYRDGSGVETKVVEIVLPDEASYSNGFAFDKDGNLWTGSYTSSGPSTQQYIYKFAAADINSVINGAPTLTQDDAITTIPCPDTPDGYFTGASDFECDPEGNIYVSLNGRFGESGYMNGGYICQIPYETTDLSIIATTIQDPNRMWNWQKAMSYDGESEIGNGGYFNPTLLPSIAGNRLFIDQDFPSGSTTEPDQVTGLTKDDDTDGDGVPDSLDNAPETANAGQQDTDGDMYGNMCDADLDNDGGVGMTDAGVFRNAYGTSNEHADFDSDGGVGMTDAGIFRTRYGDSAPYY